MAPSPTGKLHIGTARTALFNWLFARHNNGTYILRIEDTDVGRSSKEFEEDILSGFKWLGLNWDEFFRQSDRKNIYSDSIKKLLDNGKAFVCWHTKEELEIEQKKQIERKEPPRHICNLKFKKMNDPSKNKEGIIRLSVDINSGRKVKFEDIIKGKIEFDEALLGDFSIAKNIDEPLYNFAVVIDDHDMNISHVIRGEDHISNTPKQILINEALGFQNPQFAHLPLILGPDRSKMSKRHGSTSVFEYREKGYLPDAMVNFLTLLGWSPNDNTTEIFSISELIGQFSLDKIHKSGAVFDINKLNWLNSQYIKRADDSLLLSLTKPVVEKMFGPQDSIKIQKLLKIWRDRLEYTDQIGDYQYFFNIPDYDTGLLIWKKSDKNMIQKSLSLVESSLEQGENIDENGIRHILDEISKNHFDNDRGVVYWPLRVSLSGKKFSSDPVEILSVIGINEGMIRIKNAIDKLSKLQ